MAINFWKIFIFTSRKEMEIKITTTINPNTFTYNAEKGLNNIQCPMQQ